MHSLSTQVEGEGEGVMGGVEGGGKFQGVREEGKKEEGLRVNAVF